MQSLGAEIELNEDNFIKGHSFISGVAEDTSRSAFRVGYSVGMRDGIKMQQIRIQSSLGLIVKK